MSSSAAASQQTLGDWISSGQRANVSELSRASGLDRATVVKRLQAANVYPVRERSKEKQFDLKPALLALAAHPNESHGSYHHARTQKATAETARILLRLSRERGELGSIAELREQAYVLVKAMHQRFARYARDARGRLYRAKSATEIERQLAGDFAMIFDDLKKDYPNIL